MHPFLYTLGLPHLFICISDRCCLYKEEKQATKIEECMKIDNKFFVIRKSSELVVFVLEHVIRNYFDFSGIYLSQLKLK